MNDAATYDPGAMQAFAAGVASVVFHLRYPEGPWEVHVAHGGRRYVKTVNGRVCAQAWARYIDRHPEHGVRVTHLTRATFADLGAA